MKGLVILRNETIPVYDFALRCGFLGGKRKFFIVVKEEELKFGIEVEEISGIAYITETNAIKELPELLQKSKNYIQNIGVYQNKNILIVDTKKLISFEKED